MALGVCTFEYIPNGLKVITHKLDGELSLIGQYIIDIFTAYLEPKSKNKKIRIKKYIMELFSADATTFKNIYFFLPMKT